MEKKIVTLKNSILFQGVQEAEIKSMLHCLGGTQTVFEKGEFLCEVGDILNQVGIVLEGSVQVLRDDFWGNRSIIAQVEAGEIFGEAYACLRTEPISVSVLSVEKTKVLYLDVKRILTTCSSACEFHSRLIQNFLMVLAKKNLMLTQKMQHMSQRTTREKLLSYLSEQSEKQHSRSFVIPLNRQELADYLAVERSAMSNVLCKLRDEGILEFEKNHFRLKTSKTEELR